ncbi:MAG: transcriptional regulator [Actinomycetia bacterium]|nr:transcriptional regulator [Actinomycetes bacterium]
MLVIALLAGLVASVVASPRGETATPPAARLTTSTTRPAVLPARTLLFGHIGSGGRVDLLVGFGWARGAKRGTALLIPANTMVEVPSLGPQALADVPRLASGKLLRVVVENALNVRFDGVVLVNDGKLASLLAPSGQLRVDFPVATRVDDSAGTVSFPSGVHTIAAADAMRLLAGKGATQLSHLVTVGAVLDGWRQALKRPAVANATVRVDQRFLPLTIGAGAAMNDTTLPVEQLSSGGEERFRLRTPDAFEAVRRAFPWAQISHHARPHVEVLNGVGDVGITQSIAYRVVPAGGAITLTGNVPGFGVSTTRVLYYRKNGLAAARRFAKALGVGRVVRATNVMDVVDVTIVVGTDFLQRSR